MGVSAGDWGGGSRSLFQLVRKLDRDRFRPFFLFPKPGPILDELKTLRIEHEIWGKEHEPEALISYVRDVRNAMRLFRDRRIDLLHINHGHYWRPAEVLAAKLTRVPIITHYRTIIKRAGPFHRFSSLIVANSQYTAAHSDASGVPISVVYNVVDLDRFAGGKDIRPELGIDPNDVVITFLGQMKRIKGVATFLELARRIRGPDVSFVLAGALKDKSGDEGAYTRETLDQEIGGMQHVHYLGYRSDAENIYRISDIVVMPSQWDEPFGLVNLEAAAAGKPVVATRVGGIPEVVVNGESGFLVERTDVDLMEKHLRQLIGNAVLRQQMGARGRKIVETKFRDDPPKEMQARYDALTSRVPRKR